MLHIQLCLDGDIVGFNLATHSGSLNCPTAKGLASCTARGEGLCIPAPHLCVEKKRGASELIGEEADKGGQLQKKSPMRCSCRGGGVGVWEEKEEEGSSGSRFHIQLLFSLSFSP